MQKRQLLAAFVGLSLMGVGCVTHEKEVVREQPVVVQPEREKTVIVQPEREKVEKVEVNVRP